MLTCKQALVLGFPTEGRRHVTSRQSYTLLAEDNFLAKEATVSFDLLTLPQIEVPSLAQ